MAGQGRVSKWFDRVALGAIMSVVAFVVERRLLKAMRKQGESPPGEDVSVELTAPPPDRREPR